MVSTLLARNEPVVLTGCPLIARLQLDFEVLARLCGDHEMGVHTTPPRTRTFARHYGKGLGVGTVKPMTFELFAARVAAEQASESRQANYYLQAPLLWRDDDDDGDGELRRATIPALQDELQRCVDWAWLDRACGLAGEPRALSGCQLWAGHGGGSTPTHFDARDNFLCQLCGAKRVLLLSPAMSMIGLYPFPVGHVKDNYCIPDLEQPDLSTFPALARVRGVEATLEAGDVLYLPKYHWHLVRQLSGQHNLSLNFWFGGRGNEAFNAEAARWATEVSPPPAAAAASEATAAAEDARFESWLLGDGAAALMAFKAGRLAETIAAKTCGGAERGGDFLSAMAAGADAEWADGSKAARVAARIRGQLSGLCGGSASHASALLRALTRDGRLCPGLAPPVDGPVVASETGEWGA